MNELKCKLGELESKSRFDIEFESTELDLELESRSDSEFDVESGDVSWLPVPKIACNTAPLRSCETAGRKGDWKPLGKEARCIR